MLDRLIKSFVILVLFIVVSGCSLHTLNTDRKEVGARDPCAGVKILPSLQCAMTVTAAFDYQGRLWLVWSYAGHVYVNHSDDDGQTLSRPVVVNRVPEAISAGGENRPKIVLADKGDIYVSWVTPLANRFSGHVRFARSIDQGEHFSEPIIVNDNLDITGHRFEALAVNNRGDIYIAWLDKRDRLRAEQEGRRYTGAALYYTMSDDGGKSFIPNRKVMDHTCECCRVVMAFDSDQLPVVMWRHIYGDNIRDHALTKFIDRVTAGVPERVSYDQWQIDACPHHGPAISIAADGIYHLAWFNNAPQRHGLFYAHSEDKGRHFSKAVSIGNYDNSAAHADVLSQGDQVYITWREFNGEQSQLFVMISVDGGWEWSIPRRLAETTMASDVPFLLDKEGQVYVSWHISGQAYRLLALDAE
ncbi:MAG: exo-alpha-sialidase [Gammaproteobacteria bacterium]|nr:exo-alpha-sialidase [Gammaproteobacteria bacterium]